MKNSNTLKSITLISSVSFLSLIIGIYSWNHIGIPPQIPNGLVASSTTKMGLDSNTTLAFPKSGRIKEVNVKQGDYVTKGQVLAKLDAPDSEGAVSQAKGALDLALAQYSLFNTQYRTAKEQQDTLVKNAYRNMLSSGLTAESDRQEKNYFIISGTYSCDKEGSYNFVVSPTTGGDNGYHIFYDGLEKGYTPLQYDNPAPLGSCGLQIKYVKVNSIDSSTKWTISIPNTKSASYVANKNAYDLALATRSKTLSDLESNIGKDNSNSVAKAQIEAARGAYEAANGAYQNNIITSPFDGYVTFIDKDLKTGQSVSANKTVIHISTQK